MASYSILELIKCKRALVSSKIANHIVHYSGCWIYQGHSEQSNKDRRANVRYGRASFAFQGKSRKIYMHRLSYAYHFGIDPGDKMVCHGCDRTLCLNPSCLFLGTNQENMDDMTIKGRRALDAAKCHLTAAEVAQIVTLLPVMTDAQICTELDRDIARDTVARIRTGKTHARQTGIRRSAA